MSIYARSDLASVGIPVTSGGCGNTHSRPVANGIAAKIWKLDCPPCERYLRGDGKSKVIKVIPGDKEQGIPSRMEHVADCDPHWSSSPEGIPSTPDEQHVNKIRAERGAAELQQLQALIAARSAGINIPDNAMWLLQQTFDPRIIKGTVICPNGHENLPGSKFCGECAIRMSSQGVLEAVAAQEFPEVPFIDVYKLDFRGLQKICKDKGLSAKGSADQLRQRLADAA